MKSIRKRIFFYGVFIGVGFTVCVLSIICSSIANTVQVQVVLAAALTVSLLMLGLWIQGYRKLKTARLIIENRILHIRPAVIKDGTWDGAKSEEVNHIEIFVSYFGILLDSKIIKFNQDGILLKAVEIGRDFISLTYGTEKRVWNTRLLHGEIDSGELARIVEQFRYETGVVPVIIN